MLGSRDTELRRLCWAFVEAATGQFVAIGIWPRPPASRLLRLGKDFVYDDLAHLREFRTLCDWVRADSTLEAMYWKGTDGSGFAHIWFSLVTRTLATSSGAEPDRKAFSRQFRLLLKELYRPTARMRSVTMLVGLNLSVRKLTLDARTSIVDLPWLPRLAGQLLDGQFGSHYSVVPGPDVNTALVTELRIKKEDFLQVARREVDHLSKRLALETAMWLYSEGVVQGHTNYELHVASFPFIEGFSWESHDERSRHGSLDWGEVPATIGRSDIQKVVRLWRELMEAHYGQPLEPLTLDNRLWVAISRFRESYERLGWVDNLVDLTIALEALFGSKDPRETTKRLQLRTAFLLGATAEEARRIYKRVGILYDIRSRILHGNIPRREEYGRWLKALTGKTPPNPYELSSLLPEAVTVARELVRRSIRGCLRLSRYPDGGPIWPLPDDFDQHMATPQGKQTWQGAFRQAERP